MIDDEDVDGAAAPASSNDNPSVSASSEAVVAGGERIADLRGALRCGEVGG